MYISAPLDAPLHLGYRLPPTARLGARGLRGDGGAGKLVAVVVAGAVLIAGASGWAAYKLAGGKKRNHRRNLLIGAGAAVGVPAAIVVAGRARRAQLLQNYNPSTYDLDAPPIVQSI